MSSAGGPFHPGLFENLTLDEENHTDFLETQLDLINRVSSNFTSKLWTEEY